MGIGKKILGMVGAVCALLLINCSSDSNQTINSPIDTPADKTVSFEGEGLLKSSLNRNLEPSISTSEINSLVVGNTQFATKLFQKLPSDINGNIFISPYSISSALTMAFAGAKDKTAQEMASVLGLSTLQEEKILAGFNYLDLKLQNDSTSSGFTLKVANAAWGQTGFSFESTYLDKLAENYGAGLQLLDFAIKPDSSRLTINSWVAENTNNKILNLIPSGAIKDSTKLVLTNAIYFFADWDVPFSKESTYDQVFYKSLNDSITVPMMHETMDYLFSESNDYKAIELPYKGKRISMIVILPEIEINDFCQQLNYTKTESILNELKTERVKLNLPKFSFTYTLSLVKDLKEMGMSTAFSSQADFTGISKAVQLTITDVIHKAFVKVDEKGTEAAAATAVIFGETTSVLQPVLAKVMNINKPFVFMIKDNQTGTVLFAGKVVNPKCD